MKAIDRILFLRGNDGGRERGRNICSRLRQSNMQKGAGAGLRTGNGPARRRSLGEAIAQFTASIRIKERRTRTRGFNRGNSINFSVTAKEFSLNLPVTISAIQP
jgi:hypothetical protein